MTTGAFLIAQNHMLEEIRQFGAAGCLTSDQKAMIDLLNRAESGTNGPESRAIVEELLERYKKWKFGIDGRFENDPRLGEKGSTATYPFLDVPEQAVSELGSNQFPPPQLLDDK
jgi:hypothetical protein